MPTSRIFRVASSPFAFICTLASLCVLPSASLSAQRGLLDKAKKAAAEMKETVADIRDLKKDGTTAVDGAKALGCSARGTSCATVTAHASFKPRRYAILAVALTSKGNAYGQVNLDQLVRDAFESAIVRKGYTAAPGQDVRRIQERIQATPGTNEAAQTQLKDFAESIDAVLMVEAGNPEVSRCERTVDKRKVYGQELTVTMSARWRNTDTPDIPWIATHRVTTCETQYKDALADALTQLATELANALPERVAKPGDR
ncbi:MAG: hypothetical protein LCH84_18460 [Gemmatimonadetes bacterium]|nr:hypothetical protein [Gemmatimonadota bacterium]